mgnify:CR=1 FL=1
MTEPRKLHGIAVGDMVDVNLRNTQPNWVSRIVGIDWTRDQFMVRSAGGCSIVWVSPSEVDLMLDKESADIYEEAEPGSTGLGSCAIDPGIQHQLDTEVKEAYKLDPWTAAMIAMPW